jgi:YfiH family protein
VKRTSPCPTEPYHSVHHGLRWLSYEELAGGHLVHGVIVFKGSPPVAGWPDTIKRVLRERLGREPSVVVPVQTHSAGVEQVGLETAPNAPVCDALVTQDAKLLIGITVADCIPLFAVNTTDHVIGVAHCGWKGIASGICERFGAALRGISEHPDQIRYLIGVSIGGCCYEVREDLLERFDAEEVRTCSRYAGGKTFLDLKKIVAARLVDMGVEAGNIWIDKTCTACQKYLLSSYRADGNRCGRMLAFLMFRR